MRGGKSLTENALVSLFEDMERLRMCVFKPRGWECHAFERRVGAQEVVRPTTGLYARKEYWDQLSSAERALHVAKTEGVQHPSWVFTHATAALAHGLDVPEAAAWPIHYTTPLSGGGKSRENHVHHRRDVSGAVSVNDMRVTPVDRTVIDCACEYPFGLALAIADSALHLGLVTGEQLCARLDEMAGARGVSAARRVVSLADARPESGGESRVRALMMELDLPLPELQAPVPDPERPGVDYRVDFLFRPEGLAPVALELDGLKKYRDMAMTHGKTAVEVMARERQREADVTAHGIRVARMGFAQAIQPDLLLRKLAAYGVVPQPRKGRRRGGSAE